MENAAPELLPDGPAYEFIAQQLRASIQQGRLPAGTVLLEGPLAELFNVSRSPVRRAFEMLHPEGLLSEFDGRGYIVSGGSPTRIEISAADLGLAAGLPPPKPKQRWQKTYDQVERTLVHHSVFGRFRVNEVKLAQHYSISRAVARDILMQAESLGTVTKDQRRHWIILPLNVQRITDLYQLRESIEPLAMGLAALRVPGKLIAAARTRLEAAIAAYPDVEIAALDQLEQDLHFDVLSYCANRELIAALQRTRPIIISSKHILGSYLPMPKEDPFLEEHLRVIEAVEQGDTAAVAQNLLCHIRDSKAKVIERLEMFRGSSPSVDVDYILSA